MNYEVGNDNNIVIKASLGGPTGECMPPTASSTGPVVWESSSDCPKRYTPYCGDNWQPCGPLPLIEQFTATAAQSMFVLNRNMTSAPVMTFVDGLLLDSSTYTTAVNTVYYSGPTPLTAGQKVIVYYNGVR